MKQHFYNFTFVQSAGDGFQYANAYRGYDDQPVTLARIREAQLGAKLTHQSTLIACSYLGHMTPAEFKAGTEFE